MYVGTVRSPESEAEQVMIVVSKPLALSMANGIMRHADRQADGQVPLDHPDVDSDELGRAGQLIHTFAARRLR